MARELFQLSARERELLIQHYDFYQSLASGVRPPETDAQKHFVAVCRTLTKPVTEHEHAYIDFKKLVALSKMTERQVVEYHFAVQVPVGDIAPHAERPEVPRPGSHDSTIDTACVEIDEFGEGLPRPGWFSDQGWRRMRAGYRFDSKD